eukprot:jgi/Botrbrau1/21933/Bobra.0249s0056.1
MASLSQSMSMRGSSSCCACSSGRLGPSLSASLRPVPLRYRQSYARVNRRRLSKCMAALSPDQLQDLMAPLMDHLFFAYERVVLPCQNMKCGDVIHRSTLDPVLRMEQKGFSWQGFALIGSLLAYLLVRPGVLQGAIDYYILDRLNRFTNTPYTKENLVMGKKLASGGFGTVYRADLVDTDANGKSTSKDVIVKKATEFGEAEVWMNERLMRVAPNHIAQFITAFEDDTGKLGEPLWLVWRYEGDNTLYDLMQKKDWPYNMEPYLFGRELAMPKGPRRRAVTLRLLMQQILECLRSLHNTGIVHRDIKPQNIIVSEAEQRVKLIDMGAAADLRVGINYVPNEYLLDPRYAPPQQYVMSTQTPRAPPAPVAAMLSPILWRLNNPDRFDMYSAGIMFLQFAMPALRSDAQIIAFRRKLESLDYDIRAWRKGLKRGVKDFEEGWDTLDLDNKAAWDLIAQLLEYEPNRRLSADAALTHPLFGGGTFAKVANTLSRVAAPLQALDDEALQESLMGKRGRVEASLTESQLAEELEGHYTPTLPDNLRNASQTISWWQARQADLRQAAAERRKNMSRGLRFMRNNINRTIREVKEKRPFRIFG